MLASALYTNLGSNISIDDLKFQGRGSEQGINGMNAGENAAAVFSSTDFIRLENSRFCNIKNTAAKAENCNDVTFFNNLADGVGKDGFKIQALPNEGRVKNGKLLFNTVKNLKYYEPDGRAGLVISGVDGYEVVGNTFYGGNKTGGGKGSGINLDGEGSGYTNLNGLVSDNQIFQTSDTGIIASGGSGLQMCENKVVDYARVRQAEGIKIQNFSDLSVKGNISMLTTFPQSGSYLNFKLFKVSNIKFIDNKGINGRGSNEIQVTSGDFITVKNNFITSSKIYMQSFGTQTVDVIKFEGNIFNGITSTPLDFFTGGLTIREFNYHNNSYDGASPKFTVGGSGTIINLAHYKNVGGATEAITVVPTNMITD